MKWIDMIRQEPVMFQALVQATLALLISFGFKLNPAQMGALVAFSAAVLSFWTRAQVTPTTNPMTNDGARLLRETASPTIVRAAITSK